MSTLKASQSAFGINLIGPATGNLGIGNTIRQFTKAITDRHVPVALLDLDAGLGRGKFDTSLKHLEVTAYEQLEFPVNIFVHGAHFVPAFATRLPPNLQLEGKLNVAFVWWELPVLPQAFIEALKVFDVLIAGSSFIRAALEFNVDGVHIIEAKHPIYIPENVAPDRARFSLPENKLLLFCGFEPCSDLARKNPFAALRAFQAAAQTDPQVHLVIKINNPPIEGHERDLLDQLMNEIGNDPRVHIIREALPYADLLSLYASCDIFISLHRSEGLGLVPMEAMLLGKPVVATAWSGNMSYMNHTNACLVGYDFISTDNSAGWYHSKKLGIKACWAEPRVEEATAWLRKLATDPGLRKTIGDKAKLDMQRYQAEAQQASFIDELASILATRDVRSTEPLTQRIARARKSYQEYTLRQQPVHKQLIAKAKHALNRHMLWRFR